MSQKFALGHKTARKTHKAIVNDPNGYSLTITLKPYYNKEPVHNQYRALTSDLTLLINRLNRYFNIVMMTPEFTKDYNVHYHCYFVLPTEMDIQTFEQNFKRLRTKKGCIGTNYKLKKIDEVTENLVNYPFKDIERTLKYSQIDNCLFSPYHSIIQGRNPWKII